MKRNESRLECSVVFWEGAWEVEEFFVNLEREREGKGDEG